MAAVPPRTPVSIITGFLGAGKSTFLNRLLKQPGMQDCAVIINEFGEVGIDHLLVESSGDAFIEMSNGCLCCTVRGELIDTLANLKDMEQTGRIRPLRRVIIETTGLADPAPVLQSIIGNPVIAQTFEVDGLVTLVDAVNGLASLANHEEARRQAAFADLLILSKKSLADKAAVNELTRSLRSVNPHARIIDGESSAAADRRLLANGLYDPETKAADVTRWLADEDGHGDGAHICDDHCGHDHHHHHHHDVGRHDAHIRSFSIIHDRPVPNAAIAMFVDLMRSAHAEKLLRMKAIVRTVEDPDRPLILHGVQSVFHPPERLPAWPDPNDRRTRMVLITSDLPEEFVRDLFGALTGIPAIDRPDREAIENNPLTIPGMKM